MKKQNETITEVNDGITLIQNSDGLTFGTDALMLAGFVRRMPHADAAEYGSGSGIISLLLAARGKLKHIDAVEAQEYYAELTKRNAELNSLDGKVTAIHGDIRELRKEYDVIFSNPPYMKTESGKRNLDDGKFAARHEVNGDILDFCRSAARNLKYGGLFYCVYRPDRAIDLIAAMRETKLEPKRIIYVCPDTEHRPCLMLAEGKLGGRSSCDIRIFYLNDAKTGLPTSEAEELYKNGEISS